MVSVDAGQTLKALPGAATTISASPAYIQTANADLMVETRRRVSCARASA